MSDKAYNIYYNYLANLFLFFLLVGIILSVPYDVFAAVGNKINSASAGGIAGTMCKITNSLTGPIGKAIATIAVVVLGIGLFLGKLSWGLAMATAIGIGLIFSASGIVNWLGGGSSTC
jgi:type IV secretory pathway VirB2 component (pilin)